jgi:hypothetical protein
MWARAFEIGLGLWLIAGPFGVWSASGDGPWLHDVVCGGLVIAAALAAWRTPVRRAHLAILPVALWLVAHGWWDAAGIAEAPGLTQSRIVVGLSLAMFAVVPSHASRPPPAWRRVLRERDEA